MEKVSIELKDESVSLFFDILRQTDKFEGFERFLATRQLILRNMCIFAAFKPLKTKEKVMSTAALTNLRDYLTGTLSPANMLWLSTELADYAKKKEEKYPLKRYTMEEINAMIDQSEADIAAGRVYDFDEAMDELEKEFSEEDRKLAVAEAV